MKQRGIVISHDIKSMFKNAANKRKAPKENEDDSVAILDQSSLFQMLFYFNEKSIKKAENNLASVFFLLCVFVVGLAKQCDLIFKTCFSFIFYKKNIFFSRVLNFTHSLFQRKFCTNFCAQKLVRAKISTNKVQFHAKYMLQMFNTHFSSKLNPIAATKRRLRQENVTGCGSKKTVNKKVVEIYRKGILNYFKIPLFRYLDRIFHDWP